MMTNFTALFVNSAFRRHEWVTSVTAPEEGHALTITSQRKESRKPDEKHVYLYACLGRNGLQNLQQMIATELAQ